MANIITLNPLARLNPVNNSLNQAGQYLISSRSNNLAQRQQLPEVTFHYRLVGMGLGGLPIAVVLTENATSWPYWLWWLVSCYIWPWLALFWARNSEDRFIAERRNLTIDSFIAGLWVPLLHFNLLPSAMLLVITTADKISTGINRLWLHSMPFIASGIGLGAALTGLAFQPHTSMPVIMASLPIMGLHTLAVSYGTFCLVQRVSLQNRKLKHLSQTDSLTGLLNRGHWQKLANTCLDSQHTATPSEFTLILLDIDDFKHINDTFGHSAGDDVIKAIAQVIHRASPAPSLKAKLGGDEFSLVVPLGLQPAQAVAKAIQDAVAATRHAHFPDLRCRISIGLSQAKPCHCSFRQWFDEADRSLYRSKTLHKNTDNT